MSLKDTLHSKLKERGTLTYGEVCQIVAEEGYKIATAERLLRKSISPQVQPIFTLSKRGGEYIRAYKWIDSTITQQKVENAPQSLFKPVKSAYNPPH